ncbi:flavin reductase [Pararhizobium sp.]|uniref:flavin reductase n=1 Tax=Pararhizobium sp. TaxID=1977563 RepID=UPI002726B031|nr:flavin reductase [Pararhizobium sp.]MDO9417137.1 flavin reductase [Pararhizobium sp.]
MYFLQRNPEKAVLNRTHVDPLVYRDAMSRYAGHVQIATTAHEGASRGVTITAACSVSDGPATLLVCLNAENEKNKIFLESGFFALNSLSNADRVLADAFSGRPTLDNDARFALGEWETLVSGAPILMSAMAAFDCRLIEAKIVATHMILFGEVLDVRIGQNAPPLLYLDRGYQSL